MIELVITLTLASVIAGLAAPAVINMIRENSVVSVNNQIVADIQYTRSEAIKQNTGVTICSAAAGTDACLGSANWSTGWIVFLDANLSGTVDAGENIVKRQDFNVTTQNNSLTINMVTGNIAGYLSYRGNGYPEVNGAAPSGEVRICGDGTSTYSRRILINPTGRVQSVGELGALSCQ